MIRHVFSINEKMFCYGFMKRHFHSFQAYGSVYFSFADDTHTISSSHTHARAHTTPRLRIPQGRVLLGDPEAAAG